jgi:hypothetical protein
VAVTVRVYLQFPTSGEGHVIGLGTTLRVVIEPRRLFIVENFTPNVIFGPISEGGRGIIGTSMFLNKNVPYTSNVIVCLSKSVLGMKIELRFG